MATKDRTSLKNDFANGKYAIGEKFADLIDSMKVVQLPVVDPQALGTSLSFIDSISQDADGKITATKKTLDLSNAHELNPFKGWYKTGDTLPTDGFDGAYLYFKDTSELTGQTTIYRWNGTTYADTGTVVDTSNVQTFASGQAVNNVHIKDENGSDVTGDADVLSAEAGVRLNNKIVKVVGTNLYDGNGDTFVSSGTTYKRHCYVPIDSVNQSVVTISCAGAQGIAYIYPYEVSGGSLATVTFFLSDGTTTVVAETSHAYSDNISRSGGRYAIPSNAVGLGFGYRITPAAGATQDLVRDVMVSYGNKIYASYMEYEEGYIPRNPYFEPYVAAVKNEVYIAPDGNDLSGDGSLTTPFLTLNRALQTGKDVVMRGGLYNMNGCNLSNAPYTKVRISAYPNETPIIFYGNKIANTATLMSGSSKVYEKTIANPNCNWLFQWGIPDESTLIPDSERVAYHGNRIYRMPWATHIDRATSIQQIEDSENYMFYYDTTAGKIYFSCPQEPSSDNFIYCGLGGFFSGFAGKELDMKGIVFVGCSCNLGPENESTGGIGVTNSLIEDCVVLGTRMACWNLNNTQNVTLIRCEAAWSDSGRGQGGNDGFNAHSGADYEVKFKMIDCYSHDNGNDGYSDHQKCRGIIEGGLFEHNSLFGAGCGLTPAYGACDIIRNVISQNNNSIGIGYFGVTNTTKCGVVIMNCVSRNNVSAGFFLSDSAFVEVIGCVTYGNSRGIIGSTTKNIKVIDTKSFNNTNPDSNVDLVDAQS